MINSPDYARERDPQVFTSSSVASSYAHKQVTRGWSRAAFKIPLFWLYYVTSHGRMWFNNQLNLSDRHSNLRASFLNENRFREREDREVHKNIVVYINSNLYKHWLAASHPDAINRRKKLEFINISHACWKPRTKFEMRVEEMATKNRPKKSV